MADTHLTSHPREKELAQLRKENDALRAELEDSRETLRAIREGAVDALVIDTPEGQRVYTLQDGEHPYRALIEQMNEGAATLTPDGIIHYGNHRCAEMLKLPLEQIMGSRMENFVVPADRAALAEILRAGEGNAEWTFIAGDGAKVPVMVSAVSLQTEGPAAVCLVISDLTFRKRQEAKIHHINKVLEERVVARTAQLTETNRNLEAEIAARKQAELALRNSEERMQMALHVSRSFAFEWEPATDRVVRSDSCGQVLGMSGEEARHDTGQLFFQRVHPQDRDRFARMLSDLSPSSDTYYTEYRVIRGDGATAVLEESARGFFDAEGKLCRLVGVTTDISKRKQAEESLRRSEDRHRFLSETMLQGVVHQDAQGKIIAMNPAAERILGKNRQQFLGSNSTAEEQHTIREDGSPFPGLEHPAMVVLRTGQPLSGQVMGVFNPNTGNYRWISIDAVPIFQPGEKRPSEVYTVFEDITERKKAEMALRESEQRYRAIGESIDFGVWVCDSEGRNIYASDSFLKLVGITQQQCSEFGWGDVLHPDDAERTIAAWRECARTGGTWDIEHRFRGVDGQWHPILARGVPVRDEQGKIKCWAGINLDISKIKRTEDALRKSEQEFRTLAEAVPQIVWATRPDGWNIYFNQQWIDYTGLTLDESYGHGWNTPFHPEDKQRAWDAWQRATKHNEPYLLECRLRRFDGVYRWWLIHGTPIRDANGEIQKWIGTCTDIEEMKQAEETLRASREDLNRAQAVAKCGSWRLNVQRNELLWSDENWQIFGVPRGTPLSYETFVGTIHPDDRAYVHEKWSAGLRGEPYDIEHRIVVGDQIKWVREKAELEFDAQGTLLGGFGTTQDITAKKHAEEVLASAKAAAEAANVAKSQFLTNMSHELRTPMNAILGMIDVALPKAADPTVQDCLQTAKGSADMLLTLLNDLLDSSKIESGKMELEEAPFSLRRMLDQITRVLSVRASEKGLVFYCRMPEETPDAVLGDRMRLQQVLLNLAGNAIKFTERGEVDIGLHVLLQDGEACLKFDVRDTGIGIPPSSLENIFQPFIQADISTSRRFGGTGLGLSICKNLVEMMGGHIWVESAAGKGSTFYFTVQLPLTKELPDDFEAPDAIPAVTCTPLRLLLVEDNPANQKLATYILQDRGHLVEVAGDGQEAIYLAEQNHYDVILMDVQMPGMNGIEATAAIRKREDGDSRVPIIAMTAHAMKGDKDCCLAAGMDGYLSKPINAQEMIGLIESLASGSTSVAAAAPARPSAEEASSPTAAVLFNHEGALARCYHREDLLREMIQCFFGEIESLFPQMRAALEKGNLMEVGQLGHRMKGTLVYLGAEPAKEAALRVERFCKGYGGTLPEAEEAVNTLKRECVALKAALIAHALATEPVRDNSH